MERARRIAAGPAPGWEPGPGFRRLAFLAAIALALGSCSPSPRSLNAMLALMDSSSPAVDAALFPRAAGLARTTEERLRVLKRARAFSPEAYANTARAFAEAPVLSEPVALAAFDAFMGAGLYDEALALFERSLRIETRPLHYAEAYAAQRKAGRNPDIPTGAYALLADALNAPAFLVEGALAEMLKGRLSFARELARQAYERGAALAPRAALGRGPL
jgi:tetratricopeptide (TPR) repeat protein